MKQEMADRESLLRDAKYVIIINYCAFHLPIRNAIDALENKAKEVRISVLVITLFSPSQLERELSDANRSLSTIHQLQDTVRELQQVKTIHYNTLLLLPVTGGSRVSVEFK